MRYNATIEIRTVEEFPEHNEPTILDTIKLYGISEFFSFSEEEVDELIQENVPASWHLIAKTTPIEVRVNFYKVEYMPDMTYTLPVVPESTDDYAHVRDYGYDG